LTLAHVKVSRDAERGLTLTARLDAGMIGQAAGASGSRWASTGDRQPDSARLDNQIRNNAAVDYSCAWRSAWRRRAAGLRVYADVSAGTLYDNAAAGVSGRVGRVEGSAFYIFAAPRTSWSPTTRRSKRPVNRASPLHAVERAGSPAGAARGRGRRPDMGAGRVAFSRAYLSREFSGGFSMSGWSSASCGAGSPYFRARHI